MRRFDAPLRAVAVWDEAWCLWFNHAAAIPWVCALFRAVSRLGDGVFWYALMAGLHYPTDVLAGAAIGAALALGSLALA